ncbi:MAG: hypothetical protein ACXWF8_16235 [Methylobacter sp.]
MVMLSGSEISLSLSDGQMINLEVGHIHFGVGRSAFHHFSKVNNAITEGVIPFNLSLCCTENLATLLGTVEIGKDSDIFLFLNAAMTDAEHNVTLCNYADCDTAKLTGILGAAIQIVEMAFSWQSVMSRMQANDEQMLIALDCGSGQQRIDDKTGQSHTVDNLFDSTPAISPMLGMTQPIERAVRSLSGIA